MNAILSWFDSFWAAYKARKAARAQADLQKGKEILDQAEREAAGMQAAVDAHEKAKADAQMKAAAEAQEARKRLDTELSGVPVVPAPVKP